MLGKETEEVRYMQRLVARFRTYRIEIQTAVNTTTACIVSPDGPEVHQIHADGIPLEFPGSEDGGQARMKEFLEVKFGEPKGDWVVPDDNFQVKGEPFDLKA
jgi:hypothetical protein